MSYSKFTITPEYRFKKMFSKLLFAIGLALILFSVFAHDGGISTFVGVIFIIVGLFYLLFSSKNYLTIDNQIIIFEKIGFVKVFNDEKMIIKLIDINDVFYIKRQIKLGNFFGSNPYADWEDRRIINLERIVIKLNEKNEKTILRLGDKERFHQAYELIKKTINRQKDIN